MAKKATTPTDPAAPAPPPDAAPDAPDAPPPADDLTPEQYKAMLNLILRPDMFARMVDGLPKDGTRALLELWGVMRGLYPAAVTYNARPGRPPQPRTYEAQPTEMPASADVTLHSDEVDDVFSALIEALGVWEPHEEVLEDVEAHRRLRRLLQAADILTAAKLEAMKPLADAHYEDRAAAREWQLQRWFARSRIEEHRRAQGAGSAPLADDAADAPVKEGTNG